MRGPSSRRDNNLARAAGGMVISGKAKFPSIRPIRKPSQNKKGGDGGPTSIRRRARKWRKIIRMTVVYTEGDRMS
ncbi:hypothetical protein R1flu_014207 [Riccia fluitans]|uniref:Uncharacterized protein n=1 Tax=Riccia fluitans TaxID=41844 RepID=A0ABD1YFF7_9MARC